MRFESIGEAYNKEDCIAWINERIKDSLKNNADFEMLKRLESGEWELGKQELFYMEANPENIYPYLKYRYLFWKSLHEPDYACVSLFPLYLVVEPTSLCNLRCKMCWQQEPIMRTKPYSGQMSYSIFRKIVDEAVEKGGHAMTFAGRGEPLLNPNICNFLEYAANKFFELKINTNGLLLNDSISHAILKANVSLVVFSAEGTSQEEYEKTRVGGEFQRLLKNIKKFNEIREYYPQNKTQTRVSGVVVDSTMDKEKYYDFWSSLVDEVALVELEERRDTYNNINLKNLEPCYRLWQQMYIWWDGSCSPCDNDYLAKIQLGKLDHSTIQEIWNGEKYTAIRKLHNSRKREMCIPCDRCGL